MITGGARGLGRALTMRALAAEHAVVATTRGDHDLPDHDRLTVLTLDVRDRAAALRAVEAAASALGSVYVLVNNAGYGLTGAAEEVAEDDARSILETNLLGPLWLSQAVIPLMRAQSSGHIVQISTVGAVGTLPTLGLYNSSKWGLEAFSEAMAAEVRQFGIRVTLIEPGALDTDWAAGSMRFAEPHPAYNALRSQLFGTPDVPWPVSDEPSGGTDPADAADAIYAYICSDDARLRVLIGDDAPAQAHAALALRLEDYGRDPRYPADERRPVPSDDR